MKVVILHQHFNTPSSGGGIRSWYLAQALLKAGMEVIVITAHNEKLYRRTAVDGIDVHYLPVAYDNKFGFGERSLAFLKFAWKSAVLVCPMQGIDLCYAISVPLTVGISALWIKRRSGVPFIFEVGDLWPDAPEQMGFVKNYFLLKALYYLEKQIYKRANSIVALSTAIQTSIEKKIPGKKVHLISNMADCDFFMPESRDPAVEEKFGVRGKFVVSYTGAIGLANGLDYFLECANVSKRHNLPVHFLLCGDGALRSRLLKHAKQLDLHNLTFVDFQNREGIRQILNVTDASFVSYKRIPILETGSPNKFFDGLAAGKMIVINFGGWIRTEIEHHQCGIYCNPDQPSDFVTQIKKVVEDRPLLSRYQSAARQLAEQKYSRAALSSQFTGIIQSAKRFPAA